MAQTEKSLGEPEQGSTKKRTITSGFQVGRTGFRPNGKEKGKVEKRQKRGCRERHTSAHPKEDGQPRTFKRIRAERRKE